MRFINIWIIGISALLFWSCEGLVEDLDESKLPDIESKLVVSCFISPQSPAISVIVSESQPLLGPSTYNPAYVANADVILTSDAGQIRLPFDDSMRVYHVDSSAFRIAAGHTYTLSVTDGKRFVRAICKVPEKAPKIERVTIEKRPDGASGYFLLQIRQSWLDIKGEKNYYKVRGYFDYEVTDLQALIAGGPRPVRRKARSDMFFYPASGNLFSDANLDGTTFAGTEIRQGFIERDTIVYRDKDNVERSFDNEAIVTEIHVEVMNLDEHYYQFLRSKADYKEDNKFTEPTPVYTNIKGGLGCFAAFNAAIYTDRTGW